MKVQPYVVLIATSFLFVFVLPAHATKRIDVGPKAGLTFPTMTGDQASDVSLTRGSDPGNLVRGHVGAYVSLVLTRHLAVQAEVSYVQKGAEWEKTISSNDTSSTATQTVGLSYIEIPLLLKLTLPIDGKFEPYLIGGPAIGFNVGSEAKVVLETFKGGSKIGRVDIFADNIENAKGTVYEVIVAAGIDLKIGSSRLSLEGRYTRSLSATFDDVPDIDAVPEGKAVIADDSTGQALDMQHSAFSILLGYGFGFDL